jgi:hypothetical protein
MVSVPTTTGSGVRAPATSALETCATAVTALATVSAPATRGSRPSAAGRGACPGERRFRPPSVRSETATASAPATTRPGRAAMPTAANAAKTASATTAAGRGR